MNTFSSSITNPFISIIYNRKINLIYLEGAIQRPPNKFDSHLTFHFPSAPCVRRTSLGVLSPSTSRSSFSSSFASSEIISAPLSATIRVFETRMTSNLSSRVMALVMAISPIVSLMIIISSFFIITTS